MENQTKDGLLNIGIKMFEYYRHWDCGKDDIDKTINTLGKKGWELVSVISRENSIDITYMYFFKRLLNN